MTPEAKVKRAFIRAAKAVGLKYINLIFTGEKGDPDKLALPPVRPPAFVEFKGPDGVLSDEQVFKHALYRSLGYPVFVIDNEADAAVLAQGLRLVPGFTIIPGVEDTVLAFFRDSI